MKNLTVKLNNLKDGHVFTFKGRYCLYYVMTSHRHFIQYRLLWPFTRKPLCSRFAIRNTLLFNHKVELVDLSQFKPKRKYFKS